MTWTLAPKARADLLDIWQYSDDQWGEAQADRYLADIYRAMDEATSVSRPLRKRSGIPGCYIQVRAGAHIIFLSKQAQGWLIVRVLHERMDVESHLS